MRFYKSHRNMTVLWSRLRLGTRCFCHLRLARVQGKLPKHTLNVSIGLNGPSGPKVCAFNLRLAGILQKKKSME